LRQPKELATAKDGVIVKVERPKAPGKYGLDGDAEGEEEEEEGLKVKWMKEKEGLYEYRWRVDPDDKIKVETVFETKASTDLYCYPMDFRFGQTFGKKS
jgi:hypothetical protein